MLVHLRQLVFVDCAAELLALGREADHGFFQLARAGGRLRCGLADVLHPLGQLLHADLLLGLRRLSIGQSSGKAGR